MHIMGPDALDWMGSVYRILLNAEDTGGAAAVYESVTRPGGGPPRHRHGDADEAFVVLSGDVEFWVDGRRSLCGPGQAAFAPRAREHAFRASDAAPARMLTLLSPGGFEGFFRDVAVAGLRLPEDIGRVRDVAERYQLEITGPPLCGPRGRTITEGRDVR